MRSQPATLDINERRPAPRQEQPAYQPRQPLVDPIRTAERPAQPPRQPVFQGPAPQPARAAEPQPVIEAAAPQQPEAGGWLRDVLRNATAKQQSSQPQPGLSGLTEEIARSIDDTALADAWARYQSGESNVFSRRIYTLSGQGTYDDVRKKLQRDPEFARTAQAYMSEFEQLLKRAAAGSRPAQETREYLLSDQGKVYTPLAHASGRLS